MSDVDPPGHRIDQICDRFDAAWRSGKQPDISQYANELGSDPSEIEIRRRLLVELISVDIEYRTNRGDTVSVRST